MRLTDKYEMSRWAYIQCRNGNDTEEMRVLIDEPWCIFMYCRYINNRRDMRERLISKDWMGSYNRLCDLERNEHEINK